MGRDLPDRVRISGRIFDVTIQGAQGNGKCMDFPQRLKPWSNRIALVTGGSRGIGRATARALAGIGMRVAITGRRAGELNKLRSALESEGASILAIPGDQTEAGFTVGMFDRVEAAWGPVDVFVNNAGTSSGKGIVDNDVEAMTRCLELNVHAAIVGLREAIRRMEARNATSGAVIGISSLQGHRTTSGGGRVYSASKHAVRVITDGIRAELAERKSPIKVGMISPGMVDTDWFRKNGEPDYPYRPLDPEDIADAVLYLLSTPPHVQVCDILIRSTEQAV